MKARTEGGDERSGWPRISRSRRARPASSVTTIRETEHHDAEGAKDAKQPARIKNQRTASPKTVNRKTDDKGQISKDGGKTRRRVETCRAGSDRRPAKHRLPIEVGIQSIAADRRQAYRRQTIDPASRRPAQAVARQVHRRVAGPANRASEPAPQQKTPTDRAAKRLKVGAEQMEEAQEETREAEREGATEEQQKAVKELEQAKAELERMLRQLREEEMERTLTLLAARFRKMLEVQTAVYDGTVRLDQVAEGRTAGTTKKSKRPG